MFGTKCGCLYCKNRPIPEGKWAWKNQTNKYGRGYGVGKGGFKPRKSKQVKRK